MPFYRSFINTMPCSFVLCSMIRFIFTSAEGSAFEGMDSSASLSWSLSVVIVTFPKQCLILPMFCSMFIHESAYKQVSNRTMLEHDIW